MNYDKLIQKAENENKDNFFIELLRNKPLYPISHIDHNVSEFGKKIKFIGNTHDTGIKKNELGYVLGIARHDLSVGRLKGWMEVVFSDLSVYGLFFEEVDFIC